MLDATVSYADMWVTVVGMAHSVSVDVRWWEVRWWAVKTTVRWVVGTYGGAKTASVVEQRKTGCERKNAERFFALCDVSGGAAQKGKWFGDVAGARIHNFATQVAKVKKIIHKSGEACRRWCVSANRMSAARAACIVRERLFGA